MRGVTLRCDHSQHAGGAVAQASDDRLVPEPAGSVGVLSRLLVELARVQDAPAPGEPATPLLPGDGLGRYVIRREIGRGGFGCVHEAYDPELGRAVALKCLRPGRTRTELLAGWLHAEAEAIARLDHPGIVTVFDVGTCERGAYLVMELLHGETLADRLARGPLALDDALAVALEVACALAHAHGRGLLHRDLKPSNVFLAAGGRVKLLDFGLAHLVGSPGGLAAGTPAYMAPEQARGEDVDASADVYAAAVVLGETLGEARIPRRLAALLAAARSPDPGARPVDGAGWHAALLAIARARAVRRARRRAALLAATGVGLGLGVALLGVWRAPRPGAAATPGGAATVDSSLTSTHRAYRHYFRGMDCLDRAFEPGPCVDELRAAVELDPGFPLAQYQLAESGQWVGLPLVELERAARQALDHIERAPAEHRAQIRALAAWLAGREDEAAALYRQAAEEAPGDRVLQLQVGDFFLSRNEPGRAVPYLRRAVGTASRQGTAALYLALALDATGGEGELRELARALERAAPEPWSRMSLAVARAALGDRAGALAAARDAVAVAPDEEREDVRFWYLLQLANLDPHAAIPELRRDCTPDAAAPLSFALALTGRLSEAARLVETGARPECPDGASPALDRAGWHHWATMLHAGAGAPARAWPHARRAAELNPVLGASMAVHLAYAGDLRHAGAIAAGLHPGSPRRRVYDAVVRWRSGDPEGARDALRELARTSPSTSPPYVLPPSFLYGELSAELGHDREAVEALRRFEGLYFPVPKFSAWAHPKALYLLARSHERLGELASAREAIRELLDLWRDADPDLPLLADARALAGRLEAAGGPWRPAGYTPANHSYPRSSQ